MNDKLNWSNMNHQKGFRKKQQNANCISVRSRAKGLRWQANCVFVNKKVSVISMELVEIINIHSLTIHMFQMFVIKLIALKVWNYLSFRAFSVRNLTKSIIISFGYSFIDPFKAGKSLTFTTTVIIRCSTADLDKVSTTTYRKWL